MTRRIPSNGLAAGSPRGARRPVTLLGLLLIIVGLTVPAQAANPSSVAVPRHDAPTLSMSLIGASAEGVAVQFYDEYDNAYPTVFTGAIGTAVPQLARRELAGRHPDYEYNQRLGVNGDTYYWWGEINQTSTTPARYLLHSTNLLTGEEKSQEVPSPPVALAGDGWLARSGDDIVRTTFAGTRTTVATDAGLVDRMVGDQNGALLASLSPDTGTGPRRYQLDLVTFATGTVERIADTLDFIGSVGLSDDTVAWLSHDLAVAQPLSINQRPRRGGTVSSYTEDRPIYHSLDIAVGSGTVGYVVHEPTGSRYLKVTSAGSTTARQVNLPGTSQSEYFNGIDAVGDRFLVTAGGSVAEAGVYEVDGNAVTRVATVATPQIGVMTLAMSGSRLYYADESSKDAAGMRIFRRTVSGDTTPVLSDESVLDERASVLRDIPRRSISFSAGRGALENPDDDVYQWRILDRGAVTGTVVQQRPIETDPSGLINDIHPVSSGPYTLVRGQVFAPNGKLLFTRPGEGSIQSARDDIYGNRVIYALADFFRDTNTIWLHDLSRPKSRSNPQRLATYTCGAPCPRRVAIWGQFTAWVQDSKTIVVRNLTSGGSRRVATGGPVQELVLGEGTLAWQAPGEITRVLDLNSSTSQPFTFAGKASTIALDDHRIARRASDTGRIVVYRLPFGGAYRPRMLGTFAPTGFTPNGDGRADNWSPQFDLSKPAIDVVLRIKGAKSGRTLRTLTGTAPDGSIRDLRWNGRSGAGTRLPEGTYRWVLSAQAADGDGPLITERGGATVTGTVKLGLP